MRVAKVLNFGHRTGIRRRWSSTVGRGGQPTATAGGCPQGRAGQTGSGCQRASSLGSCYRRHAGCSKSVSEKRRWHWKLRMKVMRMQRPGRCLAVGRTQA